ncbi:glycoside hydrolase, partial [Dyella sp.]|uniref:glycoside hydrolase n=1 Tax=Dyella sp. TaxID=1869338 RepID=UPI002ECFE23E
GSVLEGDASDWGGGVSTRTFQSLQKAGLTRLWVGLGEGWEGGLWHPQAVAQAVSAGYLVAPYDSYETALKTGDNPDWATAHLGEKAYRDCAIEKADATLTSGFDGAGHYVDPRCVRPVLEARIRALHEAVPFNSWFLDAYGASMVFDSYRPQASMTERQNAQGNIASMRWLGESLRLVAGTEDGNAATASGYLFAHGMQTPVFGWGDPDMGNGVKKPCRSVYCLGGWYPSEQPTMFFKKVPVKELYRSVYFDPSYRLPLYQAVFHDSIVTTHHWSFDNLKLSNVHVENELAQLLYNVPPLYHLSADTLAQRLPAMKRQDAFFQPLHRVLATQAMTDFAWLSDDRLLQRTRFGDGTYLVANFSSAWRELEGRRLAPHSVTAVRPDGTVSSYTP